MSTHRTTVSTPRLIALATGAAFVVCSGSALAQTKKPLAGEVVKMAWIDPLSGLMAPVGTNQLKSAQFFAEKFSATNPAGVKFEVIGMDNKLSPTESLNALKAATDQGVRYIIQGNGSSVALALVDAINKYNERNPGKEVVYMNEAAVDPDLTNSKCSFWQFRLDADTTMKMEAMTTFIKDQKDVHKVYLLNQNYSHGQQVARYAKEYLARKRPDLQIVGEDLHPLAQVRDFAPYIAKIKQSGADTVITGNWGSDLSLLVKAANEAGLNNVKFYTYYAGVTGTPTALGAGSAGRVYMVSYNHLNMGGEIQQIQAEYKKKFNDDFYTAQTHSSIGMLAQAIKNAKSTDPVKVAFAMEGAKFESLNGMVMMNKVDHQLQQNLYIGTWTKVNGKDVKYDQENTGYGWKMDKKIDAFMANQPTSCQMKRPGA